MAYEAPWVGLCKMLISGPRPVGTFILIDNSNGFRVLQCQLAVCLFEGRGAQYLNVVDASMRKICNLRPR